MLQFLIQRVRKLNALGNDNRFSTTAESSSNPNPPVRHQETSKEKCHLVSFEPGTLKGAYLRSPSFQPLFHPFGVACGLNQELCLRCLVSEEMSGLGVESLISASAWRIPNLIGGTLFDSQSSAFIDVINPMFPVAVTCGNTFVLKPSEKRSRGFYNPCRVSNGGWIA